jgi:hypothetical protein
MQEGARYRGDVGQNEKGRSGMQKRGNPDEGGGVKITEG